jgi:hypothetical protein
MGQVQGKEPGLQDSAFTFADGTPATSPRRRPPPAPPAIWNGHEQLPLPLGVEYDEITPPIPATYADCKAPAHQALITSCGGTCPVLRCRHHVALWIRDHDNTEALEAVKIEGGVGKGRTARGTRSLTHEDEDRLAELVVDLADRLSRLAAKGMPGIQSLCSLDYADRWRLTPAGIRSILGLRPRRMTKMLADAADELDIARARLRRQEASQKADAHQRRQLERDELVQIKRKPKPCK